MSSKYTLVKLLLAFGITTMTSAAAVAQDETTDDVAAQTETEETADDALDAEEESGETDDAPTDDADADDMDDVTDADADMADAEMTDDDMDEDDDEALGEDDMDLDLEALGEVNPEEDMSPTGKQTQEAAQAEVLSENWTARNMELFEMHGYFRVRPGLYHKMQIRNDPSFFPLDVDHTAGCDPDKKGKCTTMAGADMRFLVKPTINLSEEVRINSEFIFFNNVMMGSTPAAGNNDSGSVNPMWATGYSQGNLSNDFFLMREVWGEMEGALGHLKFGRMPSHWGTGMLYNSGDGLDADLGDTVDRVSFAFKINNWQIVPAFDFPNEGLSLDSSNGRPFDVSQIDEAYRLVMVLAYMHGEEDQQALLKRGDLVINSGLHFSYRTQTMQFEWNDEDTDYDYGNDVTAYDRDMWNIVPDVWFQMLYKTFHLELEVAFNIGELSNVNFDPNSPDVTSDSMSMLSWGAVAQVDYGLLSNQLRIGLESGIASGDKDVDSVSTPDSFAQPDSDSNTYSVFSFNPAYKADLLLYRHILGSVAGTYYFNPWIRYDFMKSSMGKQIGAQFDIIYSRAYYQASTISKQSNHLGVELNATLDFATADNFTASLRYGLLFPLAGFKGEYEWTDSNGDDQSKSDGNVEFPQTLHLLMGITF